LLIAATSTVTIKSTSSARASKTEEHHELIVYDIEKKKVEGRIPLFGRTQTLNLSKSKADLVIGYASKVILQTSTSAMDDGGEWLALAA